MDLLKLEFNQKPISLDLMIYLVQGDVGKSIKNRRGGCITIWVILVTKFPFLSCTYNSPRIVEQLRGKRSDKLIGWKNNDLI